MSLTRSNLAAVISLCVLATVCILAGRCWRAIRIGHELPVLAERVSEAAERIDPNTASVASLRRLAGIGPAKAEAIVAHRSRGNVYRSADDLTAVTGIGPATVERVRPLLRFSSSGD